MVKGPKLGFDLRPQNDWTGSEGDLYIRSFSFHFPNFKIGASFYAQDQDNTPACVLPYHTLLFHLHSFVMLLLYKTPKYTSNKINN